MSFRNEIDIEDLLYCDDADDENEKLREFYVRNLQSLKKYPEKTKLADIATMIHSTLCGDVYWREYAGILGITDRKELDQIEAWAKLKPEQELYTVFTRVLPRNKGFHHVILMLLTQKRFDVLSEIRPIAEGLIEESNRVKGREASLSKISNCYKSNSYSCTQNPTLHIKKDSLPQSSKIDSTVVIIPDSTVVCENQLEQNLPSENYIVPPAPMQENCIVPPAPMQDNCIVPPAPMQENCIVLPAPMQESLTEEKIYVFILHTESDTHYARQLCEKLRNAQFKVKTVPDMEVVLVMNDTEALRATFEEVDFIVPIVSDSFLKVIHTPHLNQLVEPTDAVNKMFYHMIMNEYQCNSCINYRVRSVIPPGMDRQKLIKDIIFKFSFRLGVEDDKLIRILRETKDLIPEYRLQVNCE